MNLINKFRNFMSGRYGPDDLYKFLFGLYLISIVLDIFINSKWLSLVELFLVFLIFYRFFSKKNYKRSKENQKYLKIKKQILKPITNLKRNIKDKEHIYKKCHKCKTTLKLPIPYERGIKHTKCPKCFNRLTLLVLKKEKVEIIKNN